MGDLRISAQVETGPGFELLFEQGRRPREHVR